MEADERSNGIDLAAVISIKQLKIRPSRTTSEVESSFCCLGVGCDRSRAKRRHSSASPVRSDGFRNKEF